MTFGAEVTWQQPSSRTSPWSVWLPPQRLTQSDSHLEPRFLLILRTRPTMHSTPHRLRSRKAFPAVGTICVSSTCWEMRFIISRASLDGGEWAIGWTQPDFLPCADVSLVIGIGQGWLDDEGLTPASHRYARVVARWLEVLASYAGRPNLTVITSGMVLERLRAR